MRWIALLLFATSIQAATISGRVVDSTGVALPGVTVNTTVTNRNGEFAIEASAPTDLTFQLIGFATTVKRNIAPGATIDVTLYLSASAEVVVTAKKTFRSLADVDSPNELLGVADAATAGVITSDEIEQQPFERPGDVMEKVPGIVISQHSGEGKANQYYLRGFNLDHGTDVAISVAGVPVNMPSHAHGQGYADVNFAPVRDLAKPRRRRSSPEVTFLTRPRSPRSLGHLPFLPPPTLLLSAFCFLPSKRATYRALLAHFVKPLKLPYAGARSHRSTKFEPQRRRTSWHLRASAVLRQWTRPNSVRLRAKAVRRPMQKGPHTNSRRTKRASLAVRAEKP